MHIDFKHLQIILTHNLRQCNVMQVGFPLHCLGDNNRKKMVFAHYRQMQCIFSIISNLGVSIVTEPGKPLPLMPACFMGPSLCPSLCPSCSTSNSTPCQWLRKRVRKAWAGDPGEISGSRLHPAHPWSL